IKVAEIRFSKDHLPHILGLHKVINESANVFLTKILQGKLTHSSIKKHHNYQNIKDWLYSYNFLHRCFIEKIWHGV
ncbi:PBECR4 domain-containing protein, partial [Staphylococcus piscifermentans]